MSRLYFQGLESSQRIVSNGVPPVLCQAGGVGQAFTPAAGCDVGSHRPFPRSTYTSSGFGLSEGELRGTALSPAERELAGLALSFPHEFGEWA